MNLPRDKQSPKINSYYLGNLLWNTKVTACNNPTAISVSHCSGDSGGGSTQVRVAIMDGKNNNVCILSATNGMLT